MSSFTEKRSSRQETPALIRFLAHYPYTPSLLLALCGLNWRNVRNRAQLAYRAGNYAQAQRLFELALPLARKDGTNSVKVAQTLNSLGLVANECGKYREAETLFRRALQIFEDGPGPKLDNIATVSANLGQVYAQSGQLEKAAAMIEASLAPLKGDTSAELRHVKRLNNLASVYYKQKRNADAEGLYERIRQILEGRYGSEHELLALYYNNIGLVYSSQGRYADAECAFMKAIAMYDKTLGPAHPDSATSYHNWAHLHLKQRRYAAAEPLLCRAIQIWEWAFGFDSPKLVTSLECYVLLLQKTERSDKSDAVCARIERIKELNGATKPEA